ncbi:MAG: hypothetical protein WED34_01795 [Planctomycetales bacterium]
MSRSRALTIDVVHYHRRVPTCAHDRFCDLRKIAELRERLPVRISWAVLFLKAYGMVAAERPVLRDAWQRWPWPHVYRHPHSMAMVAIHREFRGEPWLFWGRFDKPEETPLVDLQARLDRYHAEPPEQVFRQQWLLSGLPTPARRLLWWWNLNFAGAKRAKRVGTFFLTTLAGRGTEIQHPPAFLTGNLTYGPLDAAGRSRVTLAYDHRLMDGRLVADCLAGIESKLTGPIASELEGLRGQAGVSRVEDAA